ncbi:hypothetical protein GOODEAATRI_024895, partial [Goodea atripinnis]
RVELKRLCEIFTRMFADPHSKVDNTDHQRKSSLSTRLHCKCMVFMNTSDVFSMFLETLVDFVTVHKEDLQDWLFLLLTQLLKKMGADLLGSVQAKVQKALDIPASLFGYEGILWLQLISLCLLRVRESFPFDQQFNILMRFIVDQTQTPNLKVKVAILKYIESLARQMDPTDFVNSSETRLAVSRIITWTTEPKSSDVRKHTGRAPGQHSLRSCCPEDLVPLSRTGPKRIARLHPTVAFDGTIQGWMSRDLQALRTKRSECLPLCLHVTDPLRPITPALPYCNVPQTLHSWVSEELAGWSSSAALLSTEGNLEERCKQVVLIALFELNTPEFTMLLGALPKTFQDGATKLLHNHLKNSSNTSSNVGSPSNTIVRTAPRHTPSRTSPLTSPTNCSHGGLSPRASGQNCQISVSLNVQQQCYKSHSFYDPMICFSVSGSMMEYDTENMNAEEIYSSLRGVTEAIQSFSYRSQEDLNEPLRRDGKRDDAVSL